MRRRHLLAALAVLVASMTAHAQRSRTRVDYDDTFRKYSKRYFGPTFDWKLFKAQGMTESNLDSTARSRAGARGVMQLMPSTFRAIQSENEDLKWIDDPDMNIAAGIHYNRRLWLLWEADSIIDHRTEFMFGSYNAGRRTLLRAQGEARRSKLDPRVWPSIRAVAPRVPRWRHRETLDYIERIRKAREGLGR
ncbi:MAG: transglycosylase SLT domain-containing protein [Gemmatimonadaceae bacterium]|nr:transglycosylase SLT domain-containing protein [Gemmatimonadaceae bacterium]